MRKFKKLRTIALIPYVLFVIVTSDVSAGEIDQEFITTDDPWNATMVGLAYTSLAQTFTVGIAGILDTITFKVKKYPETTGNLIFDIRHASVDGPDPFVSNSFFKTTILNANINNAWASYPWSSITVDLSSSRIEAEVGDVFTFVLTSVAGQAFAVQTDYLNGYSYGKRYSQREDGSVFRSFDTADLTFKTTMNTNDPEPNSIILPALDLLLME